MRPERVALSTELPSPEELLLELYGPGIADSLAAERFGLQPQDYNGDNGNGTETQQWQQ